MTLAAKHTEQLMINKENLEWQSLINILPHSKMAQNQLVRLPMPPGITWRI